MVNITYCNMKFASPREWISGISMGSVTPTNAMVMPVMSPTKNGRITAMMINTGLAIYCFTKFLIVNAYIGLKISYPIFSLLLNMK